LKFLDETYLGEEEYEMCLDIHHGKLVMTDGLGCGLKIFDLLRRPKIKAVEFLDCIEYGRVYTEDTSDITTSSLKWSNDGLKIYLAAFERSLYVWDFSHPRRVGKDRVPSNPFKLNWIANQATRRTEEPTDDEDSEEAESETKECKETESDF
jgi:hypothetical protein